MRRLSKVRLISDIATVCALVAGLTLIAGPGPSSASQTVAVTSSSLPAPSVWYSGCPQALLYSVRGSGELSSENLGLGKPGKALYDSLVDYYGLGVIGAEASGYPAVAIDWTLPLEEAFGAGYTDSVATGVQAGVADLVSFVRKCPSARLVLTGYSQGAHVLRGVLAALGTNIRGRVLAVMLYGDPFFSPVEANVVKFGGYVPPDIGVLRTLTLSLGVTAIDPSYQGKVFSDCHAFDVVCQTVGTTQPHLTYAADAATTAAHVRARLATYGFAAPKLFFNRCRHTQTYTYGDGSKYTFCDREDTVRARLDLSAVVRVVPPHPVWRGMDVSPNHERIVYSARPYSNDRAPLYIRNLETGATRQLTFPAAGATDDSPRWSADGTRIFYNHLYYTNGYMAAEIRSVPVGGGASTRVAGSRSGLSVKRDGSRLAVLNESTMYWDAVNLDGASRSQMFTTFFNCLIFRLGPGFEPRKVWSEWSPDSTRIAVTDPGCGAVRGKLYVAPAQADTTPQLLATLATNYSFCGLGWAPNATWMYSVVCGGQVISGQEKAYGRLARTWVNSRTTTYFPLSTAVADIVVR